MFSKKSLISSLGAAGLSMGGMSLPVQAATRTFTASTGNWSAGDIALSVMRMTVTSMFAANGQVNG